MQLVEPSVFFETGISAILRKADGSISANVHGLLENGSLENDSGETTRATLALHFTMPTADAGGYGEDDEIEVSGTRYTILDRSEDDTQTTFLLS